MARPLSKEVSTCQRSSVTKGLYYVRTPSKLKKSLRMAVEAILISKVKGARGAYRKDLNRKEEEKLKDERAKEEYDRKQETQAKKDEEEKFDVKIGKLRRKLQELKDLKDGINASLKLFMEMAKGKGIYMDAFIIKAEEARGELVTCDKEIEKIITKILTY